MKQDWQKILINSYKSADGIIKELNLEKFNINTTAENDFPVRITASFLNKIEKGNINDPLLKQILPIASELNQIDGFSKDPLNESSVNNTKGILHKYKSRVLITLKTSCAINCRYCFRRHFPYSENHINSEQLNIIIDYIKANKDINEVILSGGDPLMAKDSSIKSMICRLEEIKSVKILRIHTRLPVVIPERITDELVEMLNQTRLSTVMVLHINHPNEIDDNLHKFLLKLKGTGTQLLNQSVLLKDINDSAEVLTKLSYKLFSVGILPYYLFIMDKVSGAAHFYVNEQIAKSLASEIRTLLPGYLVPRLALEEANKKSKTII